MLIAVACLVLLYLAVRGRRVARRTTTLPCWTDDATLEDVAAQNGVDRKPVEIETHRGRGFSMRLHSLRGEAEGGTRSLHKPSDDRGELISRLLGKLDEDGRLHRDADQLNMRDLPSRPLLTALTGGERSLKELFAEWLKEHYPDGLDGVDRDELADRLATIDDEVPEWDLRAKLLAAHRGLAEAESSLQLLEGRWEVEGDEGHLLLKRTDVRIADRPNREPRSHPLPDGVAIQVHLDGELTHHGRSAMLGVTQPIQACVIGTVRQHDAATGCLEIAPIAVFQRG